MKPEHTMASSCAAPQRHKQRVRHGPCPPSWVRTEGSEANAKDSSVVVVVVVVVVFLNDH